MKNIIFQKKKITGLKSNKPDVYYHFTITHFNVAKTYKAHRIRTKLGLSRMWNCLEFNFINLFLIITQKKRLLNWSCLPKFHPLISTYYFFKKKTCKQRLQKWVSLIIKGENQSITLNLTPGPLVINWKKKQIFEAHNHNITLA